MKLVPRDAVWPGETPKNSDGTPRPQMQPHAQYLTIHYTGGGLWLDPDDTPDELRSIQRYAQSAGKPWEYNYVIDGQGCIWEYAGTFRAAHSSGENDIAIGVLLLVGLSDSANLTGWEIPPEPMIEATRELRYWLMSRSYLSQNHQMRQHNQMPGAATACPGQAVIERWAQFTAPPKGQEDDDMSNVRFVRNKGYINAFMIGAGPALNVSEEVMNSYPADTPRIFQDHMQSLKAMCFQSNIDMDDPEQLVPGGPPDKW